MDRNSRRLKRSSQSPGLLSSQATLSRLKRTISDSIRQKAGRSRFRFWPKTVARLLPAHSSFGSSRLTEKDISLPTLATPRWANIAVRFG